MIDLRPAEQLNILIVDDKPEDVRLIIQKLQEVKLGSGYEVVASRAEFVEKVSSGNYDVILCSYDIPGWDGCDALRWVRASDKSIPFIFVSAAIGEELAVDCIKEGGTDYVLKGKLGRLPIAIERALQNNKLQDLNIQSKRCVINGSVELERSTRLLRGEIEGREKAETELRQAQRLDAIGRLAAGVAHDFNNLLAIVLGQSELLLLRSKDEVTTRGLDVISKSVECGAALTRQLLAFGGKRFLETQVLNFNVVLADVEKLLKLAIGRSVELDIQMEPALGSVEADPGQLEQLLLNLAMNAKDAMRGEGKLTITTANLQLDENFIDRRAVIKPGPYIRIVVRDTGCGMDEKTRSRIFEPFFTTKEKDKGTGLGLATVYGIVKRSSGYIWAFSEPGRGTAFEIYLPRVVAAAELPQPIERSDVVSPIGSETILVVQDDTLLQEITCDVLRLAGYTVIGAGSPDDALHLAANHNGEIDFLVTDMAMPSMNGRELVAKLSELRQHPKVLYVSGYTEVVLEGGAEMNEPKPAFLQKPYTRSALICKVREVLDAG